MRGCCIFLYDVATSGGVRSPFTYIYLEILDNIIVKHVVKRDGLRVKRVGLRVKHVGLRH